VRRKSLILENSSYKEGKLEEWEPVRSVLVHKL
jgi:hypothetical protein